MSRFWAYLYRRIIELKNLFIVSSSFVTAETAASWQIDCTGQNGLQYHIDNIRIYYYYCFYTIFDE